MTCTLLIPVPFTLLSQCNISGESPACLFDVGEWEELCDCTEEPLSISGGCRGEHLGVSFATSVDEPKTRGFSLDECGVIESGMASPTELRGDRCVEETNEGWMSALAQALSTPTVEFLGRSVVGRVR